MTVVLQVLVPEGLSKRGHLMKAQGKQVGVEIRGKRE